MASRAGRQGSMSPDLKQLISDAPQTAGKSIPSGSGEEGCKVCGRDEDHANLLLCEACNEEYHTYCLDPPLECVPDDDWFCGEFLYTSLNVLHCCILFDMSRVTYLMQLSVVHGHFCEKQTAAKSSILSKMMMV